MRGTRAQKNRWNQIGITQIKRSHCHGIEATQNSPRGRLGQNRNPVRDKGRVDCRSERGKKSDNGGGEKSARDLKAPKRGLGGGIDDRHPEKEKRSQHMRGGKHTEGDGPGKSVTGKRRNHVTGDGDQDGTMPTDQNIQGQRRSREKRRKTSTEYRRSHLGGTTLNLNYQRASIRVERK